LDGADIAGNPVFIYAIFRAQKRFVALREFTLEGGQRELERQALVRKEQQESASQAGTRPNSADGARSPISMRSPNLSNVPEEQSAFAIGDEDDSDEESSINPAGRAVATPVESSRASIASSTAEDILPTQLRGMSEKARGKMPAGQGSFSRVNSISSVHSWTANTYQFGQFQPTTDWVS
jgi:High-temperature-induced dauer-formation protein